MSNDFCATGSACGRPPFAGPAPKPPGHRRGDVRCAGNVNENLNEEWVAIRNEGATPVDLTGWGIKDESASHRYPFPASFTLFQGETVTVRTGCGTDLHWCNVGSAVWNNDGYIAFLLDPNGNTHVAYSYSG